MLNVSSQVVLNQPNINHIKKLANQALEMTAEALRTDVINEQVVPFDTGATQGNIFVNRSRSHLGIVSLDSTLNYARRIYFHPEFNFQTVNNANARGLWYEEWINGGKKNFCQDTFTVFYRQLLNRTVGGGI